MISIRRLSRCTPLVAVVASAAFGGCAVPRSTNEFVPPVRQRAEQPAELEVLTGAQLGAAGPGLSLYEALVRLRPTFIQSPIGRPEGPFPVVYIDGARIGDVQRLRNLSCERVRKVQLLSHDAATARYGEGHEGGAILVSLLPNRG